MNYCEKFDELYNSVEIDSEDGLNQFDVCEAFYLFATEYHEGQFSESYKIFGKLDDVQYKPSLMGIDYDNLSYAGQDLYDSLVETDN